MSLYEFLFLFFLAYGAITYGFLKLEERANKKYFDRNFPGMFDRQDVY